METILELAPYFNWAAGFLLSMLLAVLKAYERGKKDGFEDGLDVAEEAFAKQHRTHERL